MKATGIIIEYNPMHQGHIHHIQQAREISGCDLIIGVMSTNFVQRGQPALVSKFKRVQAALDNGVDMVCELPTIYALQSADTFARESVKILDKMKVSSIVFGSETNDIDSLREIASYPLNLERFKELIKQGESYPKAIHHGSQQLYPNDILGIGYLKAIQETAIVAYTIQRTNSYFANEEHSTFFSGYDIRNNLNNPLYTSQSCTDLSEVVDMDKMYELLRYKLIVSSSSDLSKIFLVSEGIQNLLKEKAFIHDDFSSFISACTSKRYSSARISRICMHILLNITKEEAFAFSGEKVRVLGCRKEFLPYLKDLPVGTRIRDFKHSDIALEIRATEIYSLFSPEKNLPQQEISKLILR